MAVVVKFRTSQPDLNHREEKGGPGGDQGTGKRVNEICGKKGILGIAIAFLGVILVRLVSVQVTPPYQIWARFLGCLFSGMGLLVIALGVKRVR